MIRTALSALALLALAATPMACDTGSGGDEDTAVAADTFADTTAPQDTLEDVVAPPEDNVLPPEDVLTDTPPPQDLLEDAPPPPDILEDGWQDIPWDWADVPWDLEDVPCDVIEDIPWQDVPCEGPQYSQDCAEVPYFQCGFMGYCEEGVLYAEWHEHVFCEGQEHIIDYWCQHACSCKDGDIMDWPADGEAFVKGSCAPPSDCIPEGGSGAVYPGELPCCEGLESIPCDGPPDPLTGVCSSCDGAFHCTACGDDVCTDPENACNCPADCGAPEPCAVPPLYAGLILADILATPAAYDGDAVAFEGVVTVGDAICTLAECTEEDPCCNGCGANFVVTSGGGSIELVGGGIPQVGCSGSNCDFMDNCTPFPEVPGTYVLWGTLDAQYGVDLYLDGWCAAE